MSNVIEFTIDPDIQLDPAQVGDMPADIEGHLLSTMTLYCKKHKIHWTKVDWSVKIRDGQPLVYLKEKS